MTLTDTTAFNSPNASSFRRGIFTESQVKLGDLLSKAHIPYLFEEPVEDGDKTYSVDIAVPVMNGTKIAVEVFGEGTSSDDDARDGILRRHGYIPLYFPNAMVRLYPGYCVSRVKAAMTLLKSI